MLENITKNIGKAFDKISGKKIISQDDLEKTMREIRVALLEADVSLSVAKSFIEKVKEQAVGQMVLKNVSSGQMVIKIVNDCLVELLGSEKSELNFETKPPAVILMVGLQGAGKTTSAGKLALRLKKQGKKVLLASLDAYRPAAKEQLAILAEKVAVEALEIKKEDPVDGAKRALKEAKNHGHDVVILDSAGRTAVDEKMMAELEKIKKIAEPVEILLVVDAMIGQDAINVATAFDAKLGLTGAILTRLDGDMRGGVALTMREAVGCPIKFIGVGETADDLDEFDPKRIASRIVGMGDVVSLVEKAQEVFDEKEMEKAQKKLEKGQFDMEDLLSQIRNMKKMGGIGGVMKFLPGMGQIKEQIDARMGGIEGEIKMQEALILSMTKAERKKPDILNSSRKRRIAAGAGTTIQEVNRLLKKFKQMSKMVKKMGKVDKSKLKEMMAEQGGEMPGLPGGMPPGLGGF